MGTKHLWVFLSAFGIFFALLSFAHEIVTKGMWWKGVLATLFGFLLYKVVENKV